MSKEPEPADRPVSIEQQETVAEIWSGLPVAEQCRLIERFKVRRPDRKVSKSAWMRFLATELAQ